MPVPTGPTFAFFAPEEGCWPDCPPEPGEPSLLSVPPGWTFGFFAREEGCWHDCPHEPGEPSLLSVPPGSPLGFFAAVECCCWPDALVRSSPCAAEPLEPGSATATAPSAPISRPAASTHTPAATRIRN